MSLYKQRISFWTTTFTFYRETEHRGKLCVNTWTDILVEIIHPVSPQLNMGLEDFKNMKEGEVNREIGRQRDRGRDVKKFGFRHHSMVELQPKTDVWVSGGI